MKKTMITHALGLVVGTLTLMYAADTIPASVKLEHVQIRSAGMSEAYVRAIARTVERARAVAIEQFGFNMPETIDVSASVEAGESARLFNDGQDHINLRVPSEKALAKPAASKIFHLYGLCHEVGHLAMYRVLRERDWLTSAGAEGWAHYAGSRILDLVYAAEGESLWPDAYNYLEDGTARLRKQLAEANPDPPTRAAGLWMKLAEILGEKGLAPLFAAWAELKIEPANPAPQLRQTLVAPGEKESLENWWTDAQPVLVASTARSEIAVQTAEPATLKGEPKELAHDDGVSAGKRSVAGSGHAVRFKAPGKDCYLTSVRVFGSRYGQPQPPPEQAHVWLCDTDFKLIASFSFPYASFERGEARWVTIPIKPTKVPTDFVVCVGFNPTATKGVYVHHDRESSGDSFLGLPGRKGSPSDKGDWLIRAVLREGTE